MTVVHFVRHGVTEHTGHKLSGWMEGLHLTEEGRGQAEAPGSITVLGLDEGNQG